ncbi:MAG: PH domain-containing protein [Xanthobacteraceae bacterium]|nr:PH domain-containing protein [Xanthobacteraceae bacterium]
MGRYVNSILQPGERVLYSTTIHGIIYLPGVLCLAAAAACFTASAVFPPLLIGVGVLAIIGIVLVFRAWFRRWTTEADVTTMRVIYKEGFISRQTFEMSLDKVESVDVTQSILGRIFDWGDVTVLGVGEGHKKIGLISSPLEFRNHITAH